MSAPAAYSVILFDLDGTLVDHFRAIYRAYAYALERLDLPPLDFETVKRTVGGSVPVTMRRLLPDVPTQTVERAVEHFQEHFREIMLEDVVVLPGVPEMLATLCAQGRRLGVFTNKTGRFARPILKHAGLAEAFEVVMGADDTPWRKPEPMYTAYILGRLDTLPSEACLVGDSPFDVEAGAAVGMDVYTVATGSHTRDQLHETHAKGVFASMRELRTALFAPGQA